jgi:hypothetical protein
MEDKKSAPNDITLYFTVSKSGRMTTSSSFAKQLFGVVSRAIR